MSATCKMSENFINFVVKHLFQILSVARLSYFNIIIDEKQSQAAADIRVDYIYLRAIIRFGKETINEFKEKQYDSVIETLCHEVSHIITGLPYHNLKSSRISEEQEEQATEMVARILFQLYMIEKRRWKVEKKI